MTALPPPVPPGVEPEYEKVVDAVAFTPPAPQIAVTVYVPLVHAAAPATSVYEYPPVVVLTWLGPMSTTTPCGFFVVRTTAVLGDVGAGVTVPE
jgi:hypothetical protein